jgi:DAK2 domain fusion protein YloV
MKTSPSADAPRAVDGLLLKKALLSSLTWLASNQEEVNRLNVFPVPDGDTGTNMLLTLQSAVEDTKASPAKDIGKVAALAAHGSLMGARGNSGVILSQIFRGFAQRAQGKTHLTPVELAAGFEEAANAAYRAVTKPTEGTILTVAREAGRAATAAAADPDATIVTVIQAAVKGATAAVENTPSQLAILRDAGVVDAGGYGLQIMLEGFLKSLEESDVQAAQITVAAPAAQKSLALPEQGWGYCTEFILEGRALDLEEIRDRITAMGSSALVVGDAALVKVHVHTEDPSKVLSYASSLGSLTKTKVDDMSQQHRLILEESAHQPAVPGEPSVRAARRPNGVGLVAVVAGEGLIGIFKGLGVDAVVEGGQTMNPSTQDMLKAVEETPYDEIILLPNNGNVILAASQVAKLTQKETRVLETHSVTEGIAAAIAFNGDRTLEDNLQAMKDAATSVQTIEVTHAVRDTRSNGLRVKKGDVIGLVNDKLTCVGSEYADVVRQAIEKVGVDGFELVTLYRGADAGESEVEQVTAGIREAFPDLQVELQNGGQPHYPFILSLE